MRAPRLDRRALVACAVVAGCVGRGGGAALVDAPMVLAPRSRDPRDGGSEGAAIEGRLRCENDGDVVACTASQAGDRTWQVCWVLELRCRNGTIATGQVCRALPPDVEAREVFGKRDLAHGDACDVPIEGNVLEAWVVDR